MFKSKIREQGGSLVITIDTLEVDVQGFKAGEIVEVSLRRIEDNGNK
jgi:hypothetical protein